MEFDAQEIKALIAGGKIPDAFKILSKLDNDFVILSNQYNTLLSAYRGGRIEDKKFEIDKNKLVHNLLENIDAFELAQYQKNNQNNSTQPFSEETIPIITNSTEDYYINSIKNRFTRNLETNLFSMESHSSSYRNGNKILTFYYLEHKVEELDKLCAKCETLNTENYNYRIDLGSNINLIKINLEELYNRLTDCGNQFDSTYNFIDMVLSDCNQVKNAIQKAAQYRNANIVAMNQTIQMFDLPKLLPSLKKLIRNLEDKKIKSEKFSKN